MKNPKIKIVSRREFLRGSAALGVGSFATQLLGCAESCGNSSPGISGRDHEIGNRPGNTGLPPDDKSSLPSNRPNIVYLFSDQHRGDTLGATGHPMVKTPHLDRLAGQGVTFGRCYSNGPLCRPGRASMMTGLYPHDHGVWHNFVVAPLGSPSHVRRIRDEADYMTAVIGKTHLHKGEKHLDTYKDFLRAWGFEFIHELTGPGQSANIESAYSDWLSATTPKGAEDKYKRYQRYVEHFIKNYFTSPWKVEPLDDPPWKLTTDDHLDRYTGRTAAKWIRDYSDKRPFYLQVNFPGPHGPYDATTKYLSMYDQNDPKMPPGILDLPKPPVSTPVKIAQNFQNVTGITAEQQRRLQMTYYAKVTLIDEAIGDVIAALKARGLLENTWIIYGSDHGEMLGDHRLVQKGVFYEPSIHIPCILRPPGGVGGWTTNGLVSQVDVTASILEIAGLHSSGESGRSVLDKITGGSDGPGAEKGREWVLSENYRHGMLRTERYKLVANYKNVSAVELYDLETDPNELNNRVFDTSYSKTLKKLANMMKDIVPKRVWRAKGPRRGHMKRKS
ncbi:MAG: sulfatase-like hydrolase/transferase [Proteobacteria bacterium]|nr:sulfatase-like hydrolase/transferase [Pseudomonadota bacterium]